MKKRFSTKSGGLLLKVLFILLGFIPISAAFSLDTSEGKENEEAEKLVTFNIHNNIQPSPQKLELPDSIFEPRTPKSSLVAIGLSCLSPGLGHVYLGDMKTAGGLLGTTGLGLSMGFTTTPSTESKSFLRYSSFLTAETAWFYGLYAAYRDVRKYNGTANYSYQMPMDSFIDLATAPLNGRVLKKPEVWGGLLGSLALVCGVVYLAFPEERQVGFPLSLGRSLFPLTAFPVGIGEEALFRGFLQSQLSEWLTPWGGIILSSCLFGALHIPNGKNLNSKERRNFRNFMIPFITLSGIYDGWLTYKNHSLKESVARHTWYDLILFTLDSCIAQSISKNPTEISINFSF